MSVNENEIRRACWDVLQKNLKKNYDIIDGGRV
jgi:hypothetical protein